MLNAVRRYILTAAAAAAALGGAVTAHAANKPGETQMCVPLAQIDETVVIDDQTILIRMKGGGFKRMDMAYRCSGLKMNQGFVHKTSTQNLCTTDPLRVLEPAGASCMIDKIVTIDKEEGKTLLARR
jgi:hypothetical protein